MFAFTTVQEPMSAETVFLTLEQEAGNRRPASFYAARCSALNTVLERVARASGDSTQADDRADTARLLGQRAVHAITRERGFSLEEAGNVFEKQFRRDADAYVAWLDQAPKQGMSPFDAAGLVERDLRFCDEVVR